MTSAGQAEIIRELGRLFTIGESLSRESDFEMVVQNIHRPIDMICSMAAGNPTGYQVSSPSKSSNANAMPQNPKRQ